jgi:hypothetical protein
MKIYQNKFTKDLVLQNWEGDYSLQYEKNFYLPKRIIENSSDWELVNKDVKEISRRCKSLFQTYFEGASDYFDPVYNDGKGYPIANFGITDIKFNITDKLIKMIITLNRPGLLIGKGGSTLDGVEEWLNSEKNTPVKIHIIESKLWH